MKVGSLCTGIAGLELGLRLAGVDTETVFVSDIDPGACDWLEQAIPTVQNLGDFTALDALPAEVDIITAGFPCQPFSLAGKQQGLTDERYLFDDIARLVGRMVTRPLVFLENVPGLLTANGGNAMARVVHQLAEIGYSLTWGTLPAAAVGAPHRRLRWWGLAYPADTDSVAARRNSRTTFSKEKQKWREPNESHRPRYGDRLAWFGPYAAAVNRWERVIGRPAPAPTVDERLSPCLVEWMMGYPQGWVTDIFTRRTQSLHALGNAVVPQCAAAAFTQLTQRVPTL